jgi:hypothetical protein
MKLSQRLIGVSLSLIWWGAVLGAEPQDPVKPRDQDTLVRIHYLGGGATFSSWLTLSRRGSHSAVSYVIENAAVPIPHPKSVAPIVTWDQIWARLEALRFSDLKGDRSDAGCPAAPVALDNDVVEVEVVNTRVHRKFAYSYPPASSCDATKRLRDAVTFINEAFGGVMPIPKPKD